MIYSKGLERFFDDINKAAIDTWELARNVLLEYKTDKKRFKECYGFNTPEEVLSNSYVDVYNKREAYIKKLNADKEIINDVFKLLNKYGREDVLRIIRKIGEE